MTPFEHTPTAFGGGSAQEGVLSLFVHQEDAGVIETESIRDEMCCLIEELAYIQDGSGIAGNFGSGLQLDSVPPCLFEETGVLDGDGGLVGEGRQPLQITLAKSTYSHIVHNVKHAEDLLLPLEWHAKHRSGLGIGYLR